MMRIHGFEIIHHPVAGGDLRMIGTGRCESCARFAGVEEMPLVRQLGIQCITHEHHAKMGTVDLIQREQVDVGAECADIRQAMGAEGDAIDNGNRPGSVDTIGEFAHGINAGNHVGAMGEGNCPRALSQPGVQTIGIQLSRIGVDLPLTDNDAIGLQTPPGANVGLVILVGHDHLVTRLQVLTQRLRHHVGVLRSRRTEMHLVRSHVQPGRHAVAGRVHLCTRLQRGRKIVVGLHFGLAVVALQPFDHRSAGIRTAGILEETKAFQRRLAEGRKLGADKFGIKRGHQCFSDG